MSERETHRDSPIDVIPASPIILESPSNIQEFDDQNAPVNIYDASQSILSLKIHIQDQMDDKRLEASKSLLKFLSEDQYKITTESVNRLLALI